MPTYRGMGAVCYSKARNGDLALKECSIAFTPGCPQRPVADKPLTGTTKTEAGLKH